MNCHRIVFLPLVVLLMIGMSTSGAATANEDKLPVVNVVSVRRVFNNGEHNAFTDLVRFKDRFYLTFRSCPDGHMVHPTASIIILASDDTKEWHQVHRFSVPLRDTRDPHFLVFQDRLFVYSGTWYSGPTTIAPADYDLNKHLGYAAWTEDGVAWHSPILLEGTFGHYIWRAATFGRKAYLCGRRKIDFESEARGEGRQVESLMLESDDGLTWRKRAVFQEIEGDETAFLFEPDGSVLGVGRRSSNAQLLRSKPPYTQWERKDFDRSIGGPLLTRWGNRYVVGGRRTTAAGPKTSLCWLTGDQLREFAELPSGGDNSYPGFVQLGPDRALVSYYSSHEQDASGKTITAIYLAELQLATINAAAVPVSRNPQAIAGVAAGERTEARASWWGYDPADSTAALQAAINSGVRKLIVEDMGTPWITDQLTLASNQEIVFEKGVVVQAKRGAFHGSGDCLFSAILKTNVALIGPGATLRMWKQDYDDKAQYQHAEWRHVLSFTSCTGVRVEGLTLADSGGDGVYLGVARKSVPCSDVVIRNVACVNNYRQGISVISARNLLIEDCLLKDTSGTAPEAGIDFEPNEATEELVDCVMRNCVSEGNKGDAFTFYLRPLRADSKPISIRLEDCRAVGCRRSVAFVTGNDSETAGVKGTMDFINCRFEGSQQAAITIGDKPLTGARVGFVNCEIVNPAPNRSETTPILFTSDAEGAGAIGGVRFDGCTMRDPLKRQPMSYHDLSGGVGMSDISGTLRLERDGQGRTYELTPKQITEWMPFRSFKQFARFETQGLRYEPVDPDAKPNASYQNTARQREHSEWLVWAETGDQVKLSVLVRPVGKGDPKPVAVSCISPSGKMTNLAKALGDGETAYDFSATEPGAYKIICEPRNWTATVNSSTSRVCLYSESGRFHFVSSTGHFYFWVPPGTKEFGIKVTGGGGTECVKATLLDPAGNKREETDNIAQAEQFVAMPKDPSGGEIWSLRLDKPTTGVLEDFYVMLQGIPPLLSATREDLLKPAN